MSSRHSRLQRSTQTVGDVQQLVDALTGLGVSVANCLRAWTVALYAFEAMAASVGLVILALR